jgi:hypothetical protein
VHDSISLANKIQGIRGSNIHQQIALSSSGFTLTAAVGPFRAVLLSVGATAWRGSFTATGKVVVEGPIRELNNEAYV